MHLFYVVWDYTDERFFDKLNASDCSQFTSLLGFPPSGKSTEMSIGAKIRDGSYCDIRSLGKHMDPLFHAGLRRSHLCRDNSLEKDDGGDVRRRVSRFPPLPMHFCSTWDGANLCVQEPFLANTLVFTRRLAEDSKDPESHRVSIHSQPFLRSG
jgi:hypothetical protein